jgi:hypothetical protein
MGPHPNSDENRLFGTGTSGDPALPNTFDPKSPERGSKGPFAFIGNFHKTLPHNIFGEVEPSAYRKFVFTCLEVEAGIPVGFEGVPRGDLFTADFDPSADKSSQLSVAGFVSPLAGAAREYLGPDPKDIEMLPAPSIQSLSTAAEMAELYWMALLRDQPLRNLVKGQPLVDEAVSDINRLFAEAVDHDPEVGRIRITQDLPTVRSGDPIFNPGSSDGAPAQIFRTGLADEEHGPLVSQFFLHDIPYGTQTINSRQVPYAAKRDFLTTHNSWLRAQSIGKDAFGRGYGNGNNYGDDQDSDRDSAVYYRADKDATPLVPRYISTMRDLARFVNRDALHQAYFNAALFLDAVGASLDDGNPYKTRQTRDVGFASLGGPDLLTLVSEVASRALKVVWRQKWLVHRRCRPEVYGGLVQMQKNGLTGAQIMAHLGDAECDPSAVYKREYGLPLEGFGDMPADPNRRKLNLSSVVAKIEDHNRDQGGEPSAFLPMAFSAGSPTHPAYGAGHATVAGASVTVLKAWFDEDQSFQSMLDAYNDGKGNRKDPGGDICIRLPGQQGPSDDDAYSDPSPVSPHKPEYNLWDLDKLTVGGELNKIASNVAMGRTMGGVHWRSDNTRSLRLGEQIAIEILRKRTTEYAEKGVSFTFRSFDRKRIRIAAGEVTVLD